MKSFKKIREEDKADDEILNKEATNFDELNQKFKVLGERVNRLSQFSFIVVLIFIVTCSACCALMKELKELKDWRAQVEKINNEEIVSSNVSD